MKVILPVFTVLVGLALGVGVAFVVRAPDVAQDIADAEEAPLLTAPADARGNETDGREYVRLNNQFVVPVVRRGSVIALVILSLTVEAEPGSREAIFALEPKLRDALLSTLFDHANAGGFEGVFTETHTLAGLRSALRETARALMPDEIQDVLIMDLVRQDAS